MATGGDAVYRRDDGLVIIHPERAKGQRDLVASCPTGAIYYNEILDLPQKCTGCAHLLDNGWEVPRCVDSCATGALSFVEEAETNLSRATVLEELGGLGPRVYYLNYPKRFLAGAIIDFEKDEVVIGADIALMDGDVVVAQSKTDYLGDFIFEQIDAKPYALKVTAPGYADRIVQADVTAGDLSIGDVGIEVAGPHHF
jgi:uncharacterized Fe-S cluster protein YjdI